MKNEIMKVETKCQNGDEAKFQILSRRVKGGAKHRLG